MTKIHGQMSAAGKSFAIVAARWNEFYTSHLIEGATQAILGHGGSDEEITLIRVPGSFEIPLAVKEVCLSKRFCSSNRVGLSAER